MAPISLEPTEYVIEYCKTQKMIFKIWDVIVV